MSGEERGLRADAARNRARLVDAARVVFAEQGLDVSMREIARQAGVSEPTMRRRFGSRTDLVAEVFGDKLEAYADAAERAVADPDPWEGFAGFVRFVASLQLADVGFAQVIAMTFPADVFVETHRRRAYTAITEMITRAQTAGRLRADFSPEDVPLLLLAHAGVAAVPGPVAHTMSNRLVAYLLEAFTAPGSRDLPPAPTQAATRRALLRLYQTSLADE